MTIEPTNHRVAALAELDVSEAVDASRECQTDALAAAQVHATLAVADAIDRASRRQVLATLWASPDFEDFDGMTASAADIEAALDQSPTRRPPLVG